MSDAVVHVNRGAFMEAPDALLERAVRLVLERGRGPRAEKHAEISLTLLDDPAMAELNERYLGRSGPTDVLAFSLGEPGAPLGDVYVGHEQAERQAHEHGVPLDEELARLAVHGTLHVLGHDHSDGPERFDSAMFALQERLLDELLGRTR